MILQINNLRSIVIAGCLIPLLWLFIDIAFDNLGSNSVQALHIRLGDWSLRFLCLTLAVTPIQIITKWRGLADYRQLLGLYAFFYGTLHVLAYLLIDHGLIWHMISIDIIESPYIWLGLLSYIIVFLLALTSSKWAKKRMGKNWKRLHRFIYLAAIAAVMHYFWQLKGNLAEPFFYSIIAFLLLSFRILVWIKNRQLKKIMILKDRRTMVLPEEPDKITETIHNSTEH
ncbi:MAG TPA: protein-methionine-sulfoxide reductase heme-binding subunit MsrQ [Methylobacter sp.]|jgi:sulfoxide reductase heme-binding subunit YedZ